MARMPMLFILCALLAHTHTLAEERRAPSNSSAFSYRHLQDSTVTPCECGKGYSNCGTQIQSAPTVMTVSPTPGSGGSVLWTDTNPYGGVFIFTITGLNPMSLRLSTCGATAEAYLSASTTEFLMASLQPVAGDCGAQPQWTGGTSIVEGTPAVLDNGPTGPTLTPVYQACGPSQPDLGSGAWAWEATGLAPGVQYALRVWHSTDTDPFSPLLTTTSWPSMPLSYTVSCDCGRYGSDCGTTWSPGTPALTAVPLLVPGDSTVTLNSWVPGSAGPPTGWVPTAAAPVGPLTLLAPIPYLPAATTDVAVVPTVAWLEVAACRFAVMGGVARALPAATPSSSVSFTSTLPLNSYPSYSYSGSGGWGCPREGFDAYHALGWGNLSASVKVSSTTTTTTTTTTTLPTGCTPFTIYPSSLGYGQPLGTEPWPYYSDPDTAVVPEKKFLTMGGTSAWRSGGDTVWVSVPPSPSSSLNVAGGEVEGVSWFVKGSCPCGSIEADLDQGSSQKQCAPVPIYALEVAAPPSLASSGELWCGSSQGAFDPSGAATAKENGFYPPSNYWAGPSTSSMSQRWGNTLTSPPVPLSTPPTRAGSGVRASSDGTAKAFFKIPSLHALISASLRSRTPPQTYANRTTASKSALAAAATTPHHFSQITITTCPTPARDACSGGGAYTPPPLDATLTVTSTCPPGLWGKTTPLGLSPQVTLASATPSLTQRVLEGDLTPNATSSSSSSFSSTAATMCATVVVPFPALLPTDPKDPQFSPSLYATVSSASAGVSGAGASSVTLSVSWQCACGWGSWDCSTPIPTSTATLPLLSPALSPVGVVSAYFDTSSSSSSSAAHIIGGPTPEALLLLSLATPTNTPLAVGAQVLISTCPPTPSNMEIPDLFSSATVWPPQPGGYSDGNWPAMPASVLPSPMDPTVSQLGAISASTAIHLLTTNSLSAPIGAAICPCLAGGSQLSRSDWLGVGRVWPSPAPYRTASYSGQDQPGRWDGCAHALLPAANLTGGGQALVAIEHTVVPQVSSRVVLPAWWGLLGREEGPGNVVGGKLTTSVETLVGGPGAVFAAIVCPCGTQGPLCSPFPSALLPLLTGRTGSVTGRLSVPPSSLQGTGLDNAMSYVKPGATDPTTPTPRTLTARYHIYLDPSTTPNNVPLRLSTCNDVTQYGINGRPGASQTRITLLSSCAPDLATATLPWGLDYEGYTSGAAMPGALGDFPDVTASIPKGAGVSTLRVLATAQENDDYESSQQGERCTTLTFSPLQPGNHYFVDVAASNSGNPTTADGVFQLDYTISLPCDCTTGGSQCTVPVPAPVKALDVSGLGSSTPSATGALSCTSGPFVSPATLSSSDTCMVLGGGLVYNPTSQPTGVREIFTLTIPPGLPSNLTLTLSTCGGVTNSVGGVGSTALAIYSRCDTLDGTLRAPLVMNVTSGGGERACGGGMGGGWLWSSGAAMGSTIAAFTPDLATKGGWVSGSTYSIEVTGAPKVGGVASQGGAFSLSYSLACPCGSTGPKCASAFNYTKWVWGASSTSPLVTTGVLNPGGGAGRGSLGYAFTQVNASLFIAPPIPNTWSGGGSSGGVVAVTLPPPATGAVFSLPRLTTVTTCGSSATAPFSTLSTSLSLLSYCPAGYRLPSQNQALSATSTTVAWSSSPPSSTTTTTACATLTFTPPSQTFYLGVATPNLNIPAIPPLSYTSSCSCWRGSPSSADCTTSIPYTTMASASYLTLSPVVSLAASQGLPMEWGSGKVYKDVIFSWPHLGRLQGPTNHIESGAFYVGLTGSCAPHSTPGTFVPNGGFFATAFLGCLSGGGGYTSTLPSGGPRGGGIPFSPAPSSPIGRSPWSTASVGVHSSTFYDTSNAARFEAQTTGIPYAYPLSFTQSASGAGTCLSLALDGPSFDAIAAAGSLSLVIEPMYGTDDSSTVQVWGEYICTCGWGGPGCGSSLGPLVVDLTAAYSGAAQVETYTKTLLGYLGGSMTATGSNGLYATPTPTHSIRDRWFTGLASTPQTSYALPWVPTIVTSNVLTSASPSSSTLPQALFTITVSSHVATLNITTCLPGTLSLGGLQATTLRLLDTTGVCYKGGGVTGSGGYYTELSPSPSTLSSQTPYGAVNPPFMCSTMVMTATDLGLSTSSKTLTLVVEAGARGAGLGPASAGYFELSITTMCNCGWHGQGCDEPIPSEDIGNAVSGSVTGRTVKDGLSLMIPNTGPDAYFTYTLPDIPSGASRNNYVLTLSTCNPETAAGMRDSMIFVWGGCLGGGRPTTTLLPKSKETAFDPTTAMDTSGNDDTTVCPYSFIVTGMRSQATILRMFNLTQLPQGVKYQIQVKGYSGTNYGGFKLSWSYECLCGVTGLSCDTPISPAPMSPPLIYTDSTSSVTLPITRLPSTPYIPSSASSPSNALVTFSYPLPPGYATFTLCPIQGNTLPALGMAVKGSLCWAEPEALLSSTPISSTEYSSPLTLPPSSSSSSSSSACTSIGFRPSSSTINLAIYTPATTAAVTSPVSGFTLSWAVSCTCHTYTNRVDGVGRDPSSPCKDTLPSPYMSYWWGGYDYENPTHSFYDSRFIVESGSEGGGLVAGPKVFATFANPTTDSLAYITSTLISITVHTCGTGSVPTNLYVFSRCVGGGFTSLASMGLVTSATTADSAIAARFGKGTTDCASITLTNAQLLAISMTYLDFMAEPKSTLPPQTPTNSANVTFTMSWMCACGLAGDRNWPCLTDLNTYTKHVGWGGYDVVFSDTVVENQAINIWGRSGDALYHFALTSGVSRLGITLCGTTVDTESTILLMNAATLGWPNLKTSLPTTSPYSCLSGGVDASKIPSLGTASNTCTASGTCCAVLSLTPSDLGGTLEGSFLVGLTSTSTSTFTITRSCKCGYTGPDCTLPTPSSPSLYSSRPPIGALTGALSGRTSVAQKPGLTLPVATGGTFSTSLPSPAQTAFLLTIPPNTASVALDTCNAVTNDPFSGSLSTHIAALDGGCMALGLWPGDIGGGGVVGVSSGPPPTCASSTASYLAITSPTPGPLSVVVSGGVGTGSAPIPPTGNFTLTYSIACQCGFGGESSTTPCSTSLPTPTGVGSGLTRTLVSTLLSQGGVATGVQVGGFSGFPWLVDASSFASSGGVIGGSSASIVPLSITPITGAPLSRQEITVSTCPPPNSLSSPIPSLIALSTSTSPSAPSTLCYASGMHLAALGAWGYTSPTPLLSSTSLGCSTLSLSGNALVEAGAGRWSGDGTVTSPSKLLALVGLPPYVSPSSTAGVTGAPLISTTVDCMCGVMGASCASGSDVAITPLQQASTSSSSSPASSSYTTSTFSASLSAFVSTPSLSSPSYFNPPSSTALPPLFNPAVSGASQEAYFSLAVPSHVSIVKVSTCNAATTFPTQITLTTQCPAYYKVSQNPVGMLGVVGMGTSGPPGSSCTSSLSLSCYAGLTLYAMVESTTPTTAPLALQLDATYTCSCGFGGVGCSVPPNPIPLLLTQWASFSHEFPLSVCDAVSGNSVITSPTSPGAEPFLFLYTTVSPNTQSVTLTSCTPGNARGTSSFLIQTEVGWSSAGLQGMCAIDALSGAAGSACGTLAGVTVGTASTSSASTTCHTVTLSGVGVGEGATTSRLYAFVQPQVLGSSSSSSSSSGTTPALAVTVTVQCGVGWGGVVPGNNGLVSVTGGDCTYPLATVIDPSTVIVDQALSLHYSTLFSITTASMLFPGAPTPMLAIALPTLPQGTTWSNFASLDIRTSVSNGLPFLPTHMWLVDGAALSGGMPWASVPVLASNLPASSPADIMGYPTSSLPTSSLIVLVGMPPSAYSADSTSSSFYLTVNLNRPSSATPTPSVSLSPSTGASKSPTPSATPSPFPFVTFNLDLYGGATLTPALLVDATKSFGGRLRMDMASPGKISTQDLSSCTIDAYATVDGSGVGSIGANSPITPATAGFTVSSAVDTINGQGLSDITALNPKQRLRNLGKGGGGEGGVEPPSRALASDPGVRLSCAILIKTGGSTTLSSLISALVLAGKSTATFQSYFPNLYSSLAANNPSIAITGVTITVTSSATPGGSGSGGGGVEDTSAGASGGGSSNIAIVAGAAGGGVAILAAFAAYYVLRHTKCARRRAGFSTIPNAVAQGGDEEEANMGISSPGKEGGDAGVSKASASLAAAREALTKLKARKGGEDPREKTTVGGSTSLLEKTEDGGKKKKKDKERKKESKKDKRAHRTRTALLVESSDEEGGDAARFNSVTTQATDSGKGKAWWSGGLGGEKKAPFAADNDVTDTALARRSKLGQNISGKIITLDALLEEEFMGVGEVADSNKPARPAPPTFTPSFDPILAAKFGGSVATAAAAATTAPSATAAAAASEVPPPLPAGLGSAPSTAPQQSSDIWASLPRPASAGLGVLPPAGGSKTGQQEGDEFEVLETPTANPFDGMGGGKTGEGGEDRGGRIDTEAEILASHSSQATHSPAHAVIREKLDAVEVAVAAALAAQDAAEAAALAAQRAAAEVAAPTPPAPVAAPPLLSVRLALNPFEVEEEKEEEEAVLSPPPGRGARTNRTSSPSVQAPTDIFSLAPSSRPGTSSSPPQPLLPPSTPSSTTQPRGGGWLAGIGPDGAASRPSTSPGGSGGSVEEGGLGGDSAPLPPPPPSLPPPSLASRRGGGGGGGSGSGSGSGGGGLGDTMNSLGLSFGGQQQRSSPPSLGNLAFKGGSPPPSVDPLSPAASSPQQYPPTRNPTSPPTLSPVVLTRAITPGAASRRNPVSPISPVAGEGPAMESVTVESLKPVRGVRQQVVEVEGEEEASKEGGGGGAPPKEGGWM